MPELGADFGIILAYVVPGFLSLWAVAYLVGPVAALFRTASEGENRVLAVFAITIMCLATGMFLSILRAGTVDKSFQLTVPVALCSAAKHPQCGSVRREDPKAVALTCEGVRESFLIAEARDKRPYQFYGNMFLSITVAGAFLAWRYRKSARQVGRVRVLLAVASWVLVAITFYSGARLSHYRFMNSVRDLNKTTPCAPEKSAPPNPSLQPSARG